MSVRVAQLLQMAVSTFRRPNASSWPGSPKDSDTEACRGEEKTGLDKRRKKETEGWAEHRRQLILFLLGTAATKDPIFLQGSPQLQKIDKDIKWPQFYLEPEG